MLKNNNLKPFFLFPQKLIFEDLAEILIKEQMEAYVLNNHVEFKDALKIFNKKSIAFINIDSILSELEWIEYVRNIREDSHFSSLKIGILSFNPDEKLKDIYLKELKVECGYHILSRKNREFEKNIRKIVSDEQAEIGNKILKLDFKGEESVLFRINEKMKILEGSVNAISSAAMSITLEKENLLKKGMKLNDIRLSFRDNQCKMQGTVVGNSQSDKNQFIIKFNSVYLDIHDNPISNIIHKVLDTKMRELVR